MSRPRQAEDPGLYPEPCARCREHRQTAATWPDGRVCVNSYQRAKRTRGTCACGHDGVLPGVIDGEPACRQCSGIRLNVDCKSCGAEEELHSGGRCWRCVLTEAVDTALGRTGTCDIPPQLAPLADALKGMKRANSGLTWIRQTHVQAFLRSLTACEQITHEAIDRLPASPTREYVRGLLIEYSVLTRRDTYSVRYDEWSEAALETISSPENRDVIRRYIRWHHKRRMNQLGEVQVGTFLHSKQTVTVAIDLLNWLTGQEIRLGELTQGDLDLWISTGPSTRLVASRFLSWAIKAHLVNRDLKIERHRRGTSPRLSAFDQEAAISQAVHTSKLSPRDRAAAMLVLVFAQQVEDIARLTWDQVQIAEETVTIRMGSFDITLPEPLDEPWRQMAAAPMNDQTASHPDSKWVFRGYSPGRHINPQQLRQRLGKQFSAKAARLGTLHELTKLAPVAIVAEALGYAPATIERNAIDSATAYTRYIAAIHET
jgi:hypothetical protein